MAHQFVKIFVAHRVLDVAMVAGDQRRCVAHGGLERRLHAGLDREQGDFEDHDCLRATWWRATTRMRR